ncbi:MAG: hypothetical protein P1U32_06395 [Legionellaceae bacterium]|nr:hypothetical protein [Legionellaceae bacterium]
MNRHYLLLSVSVLYSLSAGATTHYPAEIVGRDLDTPLIYWLGHVGITYAENPSEPTEDIIEVLPGVNVIQINPLSDFKQRSHYWGSRYGIADRGESAEKVIGEALKQRALCPIYTMSDTFRAGLGTPDNPIRCAVFRCDTFVNHVFHAAGHNLATYNGITMPLRVFYQFPKAHHDNKELNKAMPFSTFKAQVDLPLEETTPASIHYLWELAKNPHLSLDKRLFLLDYLGLNGTPDLIDAFIEYYDQTSHYNLKNMLIRSTFTLYQTHFASEQHPALQAFYQHLLTETLDTEALPFVIRGFVTLSNKKDLLLYQYRINQQLALHANTLPAENKLILNLLLAFKTPLLEEYYVTRSLLLLHEEDNPHLTALFKEIMLSRIKNAGENALTAGSKAQLKQYLPSFSVGQ